jgi:anti-sigma-K factor RskA
MSVHEQFAEDLALYAIGSLDGPARAALEAHLGTCGECRRELEALRSDVGLLALSVTGPQPPQRARQRLMDAVAAESSRSAKNELPLVVGRLRPRWLGLAPIAVALALAVFSFGLLLEVQRLKEANAKTSAALQDEINKSREAREIVAMLNDPKAQQVVLVPAHAEQRQPQVKTIYVRDKGHVLLTANNLAELPADKVYELWLMPANGGPPMPSGTFNTDWRGHGMMLHYLQTAGIDAKGFAITIEPESGSQTPTPPIVMQPGS